MASKSRKFNGMTYREIQSANSQNRIKLKKEHQKWLKDNSYKNVGWDNVIKLYQAIDELIRKGEIEEMSLEELFLEADRIGNKYQTTDEREEYNRKLSEEATAIGELIERQFPDTEIEVIDYSKKTTKQSRKQRNQKIYRTAKI